MNKLSVGLLSCSLAFGGYAWGENPANDSRRMPTIEDRLTQLEQAQGDLGDDGREIDRWGSSRDWAAGKSSAPRPGSRPRPWPPVARDNEHCRTFSCLSLDLEPI